MDNANKYVYKFFGQAHIWTYVDLIEYIKLNYNGKLLEHNKSGKTISIIMETLNEVDSRYIKNEFGLSMKRIK